MDDYDDMMVDFSQCVEVKQRNSLYKKDYDETTTKFYRTLRENKINVIMQENTGFSPEKAFCFKYQWDPYTGNILEQDPYGFLYFHPDDLIRYFYIKRLDKLWTDPVDLQHGYHIQGYYGEAVGSGEDIMIVGRGAYPESYLFRLPIFDCYLEKNHDMSLITMGPKLTLEDLMEIDSIAEKSYKNNYKNQYGKKRPSLATMKILYDQAISKEPNLDNIIEYQNLKNKNISKEKLQEFRDKANRIAVDALRKM